MQNQSALIVFAKNPILGKVKTRLAKNLGEVSTLLFYKELMKLTSSLCAQIYLDIHIFYADFIPKNDNFSSLKATSHLQSNDKDLGVKMYKAFKEVFQLGYKNVGIIGTDCPYIKPIHVESSIIKLSDNDTVIGPSKDGGFYMLFIKSLATLNFNHIEWSTSTVTKIFLQNLSKANYNFELLETLEDIDDIESYNNFLNYRQRYELQ